MGFFVIFRCHTPENLKRESQSGVLAYNLGSLADQRRRSGPEIHRVSQLLSLREMPG